MKAPLLAVFFLAALLLVGCQSRSISDSGYSRDYAYQGELSELAVLGVNADKAITEDDIQSALGSSSTISLRRGDTIVLVQSGARFPDEAFVEEAARYYRVVPISGIPSSRSQGVYRDFHPPHWNTEEKAEEQLDMALRLAAARAGAKTLIVYWGVLETTRDVYATKAVSWVPIVGHVLPDEARQTRIRMKAAVIDVASGQWQMLTPEVYEDENISSVISRSEKDQAQVTLLKAKAYKRLFDDIRTRFEQ